MKPFYFLLIFLTPFIFNQQVYGNETRNIAVGDSNIRHIGFRLSDASFKSIKIDRLNLRFFLLVNDKKTSLSIHYYHDEHGNLDPMLAAIQVPPLTSDSTSEVHLMFCKGNDCYTYDVSEITYTVDDQLYFKEFYHLEFYQFTSFKQYKTMSDGNTNNWETLNQFNKKDIPEYVLVKWMPGSERWIRTELRFLN